MRIVDACVEIGRLPMWTWDAGDAIMEPLLFCLDFVRVMCASRLLDWGAGDLPVARRRLYGSGVPEGATATATRGRCWVVAWAISDGYLRLGFRLDQAVCVSLA